MLIFVFHFNRGKYLENMIASLERHTKQISPEIIIFDDDSTDAISITILERLSQKYEVFKPLADTHRTKRVGGLSANMDTALQYAWSRGEEIVLFLQDDMQVIRDITPTDIENARRSFEHPNASVVVRVTFSTASQQNTDQKLPSARWRSAGVIQPNIANFDAISFWNSFGDTGFFSVELYKSFFEHLFPLERENAKHMFKMKRVSGRLALPFAHFLPLVTTSRGRKRKLKNSIADWVSGAGVHPIAPLSDRELNLLAKKSENGLPTAEATLTVPTLPRLRYWPYYGAKSNLDAHYGWRRALGRVLYGPMKKGD